MNHPLFGVSSRKCHAFLVLGLCIFCFIPKSCNGDRKRYSDSMAYDDVIRDVPRSLRAAHDRGVHLWESEVTKYSQSPYRQNPSLRSRLENVVRSLQNSLPRTALKNVTFTPPTSSGLSQQCKTEFDAFFDGLLHGKLWALKILDAWGKPQSGMLEIHIRSFGDYYQCKHIVGHHSNLENGTELTVRGLFCMSTLTIFEDITNVIDVSIQEGMCVPRGCSQHDVRLVMNELLALTNSSQYFVSHNVECHPGHQLDNLAIFGIATLGVLVAFVTMATALDYLTPAENKNDEKHAEEGESGDRGNAVESNGGISVNNHSNNRNHVTNNHVTSSYYQRLSPSPQVWTLNRESFKVKLLLSFSLRVNFKKLFDTKPNKSDAMECIHGLRFFTMCWIILGHTILLTAKRAENYVSYAKLVAPYFFYQIYYNSTFACDSFLCFSGILVCYNLMHHLKYFKGKMRWHLFYIYRYMRLTPAMGFVMLIYASTFQFWNDGPVWEARGVEPHRCRFTWWHNLLYINNFFHNQCMGWLWYLAVDTQLYCISPLFVIILYKKPRYGIAFLVLCMVASLIGTAFIVHDLQLPPTSVSVLADNMTAKADPMVSYYYAPWCRLSPYIIGMLTGYLFYVTDRKMLIPKYVQVIGWSLVCPTSALIIFGLYRATLLNPDLVPVTLTQAVVYSTLSRPAWGLIVCWVIVICVTGYGGLLNTVLTWRPLVPLARVTYMAYMIHVIVQLWWLLSREKPITLTDSGVGLMYLGYVLMTFLIALPATLVFEAPIMSMQRVVIERHEQQQKEKRRATLERGNSTASTAHDQGDS